MKLLSFLMMTFGLAVGAAPAVQASDDAELIARGEAVFGEVCAVCHGPSADGPDRIAPPIFATKNHYSDLTEREAFVEAVATFVVTPSESTTRMPGAVKKFGLMPEQELSEDDARAVAEFLFATDFSIPDWYAKHYEEEHGESPGTN